MASIEHKGWLDALTSDAREGARRLAVLVDPEDAPSGKHGSTLSTESIRATQQICLWVAAWSLEQQRVVQELKRALSLPVVLFLEPPHKSWERRMPCFSA